MHPTYAFNGIVLPFLCDWPPPCFYQVDFFSGSRPTMLILKLWATHTHIHVHAYTCVCRLKQCGKTETLSYLNQTPDPHPIPHMHMCAYFMWNTYACIYVIGLRGVCVCVNIRLCWKEVVGKGRQKPWRQPAGGHACVHVCVCACVCMHEQTTYVSMWCYTQ